MNEKTWVANLRMKNEGTCKREALVYMYTQHSRNAQSKCKKFFKKLNIHNLNVDVS